MIEERYGWQPGELRVVGQDTAASTEVPQEHQLPMARREDRVRAAQALLAAASGENQRAVLGGPNTFAMPDDLEDHWVHGEGAAKIRWCTEGSFDRARRALREHVPAPMLDGTVANLFHKACGKWPGQDHD